MAETTTLKILSPLKSPTGFVIVPIHYTMDPAKTDPDWIIAEQAKYRRENVDWQKVWDREMELDFTSVSGSPAYPHFSAVNIKDNLTYSPHVPLRLCCDFNIEPMIWEVAQVVRVLDEDIPVFLDEIMLTPGTVDDMISEFRNRYVDHPAGVWIYGDATGRGRSGQTGKSYYDLIRLAFRGYSSEIKFLVGIANPDQRDRLNAFNLKLKDPDGRPGMFIHKEKCPHLIKDMYEVVTKEDGSKIVKSSKREDPYFWRTHASDAAGYFIYREWPVVREVSRKLRTRRKPVRRQYGTLLGEM